MDQIQELLRTNSLLLLAYLIGSVTFIIGLKMLSHPDSARRGNLVAAFGMAVAIFATIFLYEHKSEGEGVPVKLHNYTWIFGGLVLGTIVGWFAAKKVQMTAMPEMVSLFNGMGGACAMLISIIEYRNDSMPLYGQAAYHCAGHDHRHCFICRQYHCMGQTERKYQRQDYPRRTSDQFSLVWRHHSTVCYADRRNGRC